MVTTARCWLPPALSASEELRSCVEQLMLPMLRLEVATALSAARLWVVSSVLVVALVTGCLPLLLAAALLEVF